MGGGFPFTFCVFSLGNFWLLNHWSNEAMAVFRLMSMTWAFKTLWAHFDLSFSGNYRGAKEHVVPPAPTDSASLTVQNVATSLGVKPHKEGRFFSIDDEVLWTGILSSSITSSIKANLLILGWMEVCNTHLTEAYENGEDTKIWQRYFICWGYRGNQGHPVSLTSHMLHSGFQAPLWSRLFKKKY